MGIVVTHCRHCPTDTLADDVVQPRPKARAARRAIRFAPCNGILGKIRTECCHHPCADLADGVGVLASGGGFVQIVIDLCTVGPSAETGGKDAQRATGLTNRRGKASYGSTKTAETAAKGNRRQSGRTGRRCQRFQRGHGAGERRRPLRIVGGSIGGFACRRADFFSGGTHGTVFRVCGQCFGAFRLRPAALEDKGIVLGNRSLRVFLSLHQVPHHLRVFHDRDKGGEGLPVGNQLRHRRALKQLLARFKDGNRLFGVARFRQLFHELLALFVLRGHFAGDVDKSLHRAHALRHAAVKAFVIIKALAPVDGDVFGLVFGVLTDDFGEEIGEVVARLVGATGGGKGNLCPRQDLREFVLVTRHTDCLPLRKQLRQPTCHVAKLKAAVLAGFDGAVEQLRDVVQLEAVLQRLDRDRCHLFGGCARSARGGHQRRQHRLRVLGVDRAGRHHRGKRRHCVLTRAAGGSHRLADGLVNRGNTRRFFGNRAALVHGVGEVGKLLVKRPGAVYRAF